MRDNFPHYQKRILTETVINGKRITYDGCSSNALEEAVKFYTPDRWIYLGKSKIAFYEGVENKLKKVHHFFNLKK